MDLASRLFFSKLVKGSTAFVFNAEAPFKSSKNALPVLLLTAMGPILSSRIGLFWYYIVLGKVVPSEIIKENSI